MYFRLQNPKDDAPNTTASRLIFSRSPAGEELRHRIVSGIPTHVRRDLAIVYSAINRCVTLLGTTISSMPVEVWTPQHSENGSHRLEQSDYYRTFAAHSLIDGMNCWVNAFCTVLIDALLTGNGYFKIERDERGRVIGLFPLKSEGMSVYFGGRGSGYMASYLYRYEDGTERKMWPPGDIVHIRMPQLHSRECGTNRYGRSEASINANAEILGTSPLVALANQIDIGVSAEEFVAAYFASAPSTSFITSPSILTEGQKDEISTLITDIQNGGKETRRLPLILSGGAEYKQVDSTPQSMTLAHLRDQNKRDVCEVYGVPPIMLGDDSQSTSWGTGITALMRGFHRTAIQPLAAVIEAQLTAKVSRGRVLFKFDSSDLTRESQKDEAMMLLSLVGSNNSPGIISLEEIRARLGFPPIKESDTFFTPQQFGAGGDPEMETVEGGDESANVTSGEDKPAD